MMKILIGTTSAFDGDSRTVVYYDGVWQDKRGNQFTSGVVVSRIELLTEYKDKGEQVRMLYPNATHNLAIAQMRWIVADFSDLLPAAMPHLKLHLAILELYKAEYDQAAALANYRMALMRLE